VPSPDNGGIVCRIGAMSCEHCEELHKRFAIRSPAELAKAIRVIQASLADGTLEQSLCADLGASTTPFRTVRDSGPWNDFLLYKFVCRSCRAGFQLSAETYRGRGGEWQPIEKLTG
jgi:hypothetical protein